MTIEPAHDWLMEMWRFRSLPTVQDVNAGRWFARVDDFPSADFVAYALTRDELPRYAWLLGVSFNGELIRCFCLNTSNGDSFNDNDIAQMWAENLPALRLRWVHKGE